ncbi:TonB-dependent receptor [Cytophagaceae bacterium DM2B3-1]|uniref:TonB-dependent receptor n=1 Tax=Xanthocytophaga flava TaxID=3048013 RepID=A0ABT7CXQ9_9BACT|nr:TonB-dependent receptor [Xanthocytophaga flavus]MDJ1498446.1 TonB-dependent receptor [Xanthocytophaga flavus]
MRKFLPKLKLLVMLLPIVSSYSPVIAQEIASAYSGISIKEQPNNLQIQSLKTVLTGLETKYKISFSYDRMTIEHKSVKKEHRKYRSLDDELTSVLTPLNLNYQKLDSNLYLIVPVAPRSKDQSFYSPASEIAESLATTITGSVKDNEGVALPGVSVVLKGTITGTTTNHEGKYSLSIPSDKSDQVLVFSFIGYMSIEVPVGNKTVVDVVLQADVKALSEVVVIGYGTVKKSDLTGSVASVREKELTAIPVTNALESLQGKVAGLDLTRTSGQPGAGLNFTIRGNRSLSASNQPLILVDGIQYSSTVDINPNDIASIEVLKDASSTAIYGTRGANGVILITTKKGASGSTKVSFNSYYGVQNMTGYADIMDGPQWVQLRREARRTAGEWNSPEDDSKIFNATQLENYNNGIWTDWAKEILGSGSQQNYQIGLSGGSDKTTFYASLEYFKEKGLLRNDDLQRYNGRFTLEHSIHKNLKVGINLLYTYKDRNARNNPLNQANKMSPLGRPYDDEGNFLTFPVGDASTLNPLVDEQPGAFVNNTIEKRMFSTLNLNWEIVKGLSFQTRLGVNTVDSRTGYFAATNTIDAGPNGQSIARASENPYQGITWENFLTFDQAVGIHSFNVVAGTSTIKSREETYSAEGRNLSSPTFSYHNLGASQNAIQIQSKILESQLASYFARFSYKLADKYLFNATLRADGSSVLAKGHKWGYFPSAAVAWKLKEEGFLRPVDLVSDLKVRASYGISGTSAVQPYQTTGGLGKSTYAFDQGNSEVPAYGYFPMILAAPQLSWEKTATTNFGIDFGLMNNRITGSVDIYQQDTRDLLLQRNIPTSTGYRTTWDNIGKTRNRGIEAILSLVALDSKGGFRWNTDFNFTSNKEEIRQLSLGNRDLANSWFVGSPTQVWYDYEKIGIWQLNEEDEATKYGQIPGQIKVRDLDNNGTITPEDRIILGTQRPKWTLGINNRFSYKGFELTVFVYSRIGQMISSEAANSYKIDGLENGTVVDYWTPENPTNAYPRPDSRTNRTAARYYSTLRYVNGSFTKIRDITLAYTFPDAIRSKLSLSRLRVYASAKNYFTFSKMAPYDPERGGALDFPMTRLIVFGINADF